MCSNFFLPSTALKYNFVQDESKSCEKKVQLFCYELKIDVTLRCTHTHTLAPDTSLDKGKNCVQIKCWIG